LKILHTNFLKGWGGQSNRILEEASGAAALGYLVTLSVPPGSELAKRGRAAGLTINEEINYSGPARAGFLRDVKNFRRLIAQLQPDIIHLHGGRDSWVAAAALYGRSRPVIARTKHNIFPITGHPLNRWIYSRFFDYIICISSAVLAQCTSRKYINPGKLILIPSACDVDQFQAARSSRQQMREAFGFKPNNLVICMTGRLREEKGHQVLFAAAPQIVNSHPDVRFLLLGSGSLHGEFLESIEKTNSLKEKIVLAGFRTDVPQCLSAADIYVQPSLSEGLGTAVLEACAAGLPVVASRSGGIPDIIINDETGLLVDVGSSHQLAEAVDRLIESPSLRERLSAGGLHRVRENYSVQALIDRTDNAYRQMISGTKK
jgi:glycosyltransferase involved in cell wall biosynthesis